MAGGQEYSKYQKGIINRYYEHLDTITVQKLGEAVSELYLCDNPKKAERLWESVRTGLSRTGAPDSRVQKILDERNIQGLAQLVNELALDPKLKPKGTPMAGNAPAAPPPTPAPAPGGVPPTAPPPAAGTPGTPGAPGAPGTPAPAAAGSAVTPEALKSALKAFRKRLKLTRLDEDSRLGVGPLTKGSRSQIVAIQPPNQFPTAVWEELANQGKLKRAGRGFYELVGE